MLTELFYTQNNISCSILGSWLVLKSVVYLDSALCNDLLRSHFIHLLSTKELIHHNPVTLQGAKMLQWLYSKSLKISNVLFTAETERSPLLVQFFESFGNSVRCVHFRDKCNEMDTMYLAACYCKHITILRCTNVSISLPFYAILRNNPNIHEIWVHSATCVLPNLMNDLVLHKLHLLSVQDTSSLKGFPWSANTHSNSLHRVECVGTNITIVDTNALTTNCPNIRSFSCARIRITDSSLQAYLRNRPELIHLSLSGNDVVTDDGILYAAQQLSCLRTLNIQKCNKLTVASLAHIAEHRNKLEILYCDITDSNDVTERTVQELSQKCTSMTYLNICSNFILCTTTCTWSLLEGCPALHTLVINDINNITLSGRKLASLMKPHLEILVHDESTKFDVLTLPIPV